MEVIEFKNNTLESGDLEFDKEHIKVILPDGYHNEMDAIILDEYDGVKEEVSLQNNLLFLWHNYKKNYEEWFVIRPKKQEILISYLSNKIGILTLMENSEIFLAKRYYDQYNHFEITEEIDINNTDKQLPLEDVKIGKDLYKSIVNNLSIDREYQLSLQYKITSDYTSLLSSTQISSSDNTIESKLLWAA